MNNTENKLTYETLMSYAEQLGTSANDMKSILDNVTNLFGKIGQEGIWQGESATYTKEEFETLSAKFGDFVNAVTDCKNHLHKVVEDYKAVDRAVQDM